MSHTAKTRPTWVRFFDDPTNVVEHHDHRAGPCDLPSRHQYAAAIRTAGWNPLPWRCGYELAFHRMPPTCCCRMCRGWLDLRGRRRRDRHATRVRLAAGNWD